ncbi:MAG: hypothetical protein AAB710_00995 [Patescibacteria group bacterium]
MADDVLCNQGHRRTFFALGGRIGYIVIRIMIESYLYSGFTFFIFLISHGLFFYIQKPKEPWKAVSRLAKLFFVLYTILFFVLPFPNWFSLVGDSSAARIAAYINGAVLYIFLFFSYAQVYFLFDRGISARILVELLEAGDAMKRDELRKRYDPNALQDRRLADMVYGGHVQEQNGSYRLSTKGRFLAKAFRWGKKILNFYPGG